MPTKFNARLRVYSLVGCRRRCCFSYVCTYMYAVMYVCTYLANKLSAFATCNRHDCLSELFVVNILSYIQSYKCIIERLTPLQLS